MLTAPSSVNVRMDPTWIPIDSFIEIIRPQEPTGLGPETAERWRAAISILDPRRDLALFLHSTPDADDHWLSRFITEHNGQTTIH
jgi:hypothetical protein